MLLATGQDISTELGISNLALRITLCAAFMSDSLLRFTCMGPRAFCRDWICMAEALCSMLDLLLLIPAIADPFVDAVNGGSSSTTINAAANSSLADATDPGSFGYASAGRVVRAVRIFRVVRLLRGFSVLHDVLAGHSSTQMREVLARQEHAKMQKHLVKAGVMRWLLRAFSSRPRCGMKPATVLCTLLTG